MPRIADADDRSISSARRTALHARSLAPLVKVRGLRDDAFRE
jgi:hypothetical protein